MKRGEIYFLEKILNFFPDFKKFRRFFLNFQIRFCDSILIMVKQFFLVIHKYYYPYIVTQSRYLEKTAIKLTYIRQQSSADPILSKTRNSVFVCYKSYCFCESPAFSMFRKLTVKTKLLIPYGKKTWDSILV